MKLPFYSLAGLATMAISELAMLRQVEPFWTWHTPLSWTGYIFFVDGVVWLRSRRSWLTTARAEFLFLAVMSVPLWLIFEGYNLLIENWYYVNLPEHPVPRYAGYAWSFATIWPAIFETGDLVGTLRATQRQPPSPALRAPSPPEAPAAAATSESPSRGAAASGGGAPRALRKAERVGVRGVCRTPPRILMAIGALMLTWPIVWPSPYLAAPVWLGFILLLDPINAHAAHESLLADTRAGRYDRLVNLSVAGLICGLIWEFWNYWARAKWIYTVPIMPNIKLFEMPLAGYLGFPAFALECFTMYVFARRALWRRPGRSISV
jgi:hypothetical protein